jgi:hypothetical protein
VVATAGVVAACGVPAARLEPHDARVAQEPVQTDSSNQKSVFAELDSPRLVATRSRSPRSVSGGRRLSGDRSRQNVVPPNTMVVMVEARAPYPLPSRALAVHRFAPAVILTALGTVSVVAGRTALPASTGDSRRHPLLDLVRGPSRWTPITSTTWSSARRPGQGRCPPGKENGRHEHGR